MSKMELFQNSKLLRICTLAVLLFIVLSTCVYAQSQQSILPVKVSIGVEDAQDPGEMAKTMKIFFFITILSLAPALMIMVTSFTRIVIVLAFLKRSLATGSQPSAQILVGLALFLTFFIMAPVWTEVNAVSVQPYMKGDITQKEAFNKGTVPVRQFLFKQTRKKDLELFIQMAKMEKPRSKDEIPTYVLIPAFIISELKTAFQMGFLLYLPFLIIDMTVASVLLSMGMMMLPPVMVSMPFKVLLFVLVDGWYLIVKSLSMSF